MKTILELACIVVLCGLFMGIGANLAHKKAKGKVNLYILSFSYDFSKPTKYIIKL